ncbi:MAG: hypothetical protein JNM38_02615 [Acidobacteria bacterium]|nr:hypothetical protein [Acidobacteriota bacterium]
MILRTRHLLAPIVAAIVAATAVSCTRADRKRPEQLRAEIAALEAERDQLRARLEALSGKDPRREGMPQTAVRIAVPTGLAEDLIQRVITGFVDRVTLELKNIKVRKSGAVRKVIHIGDYTLLVNIDKVVARLKTGKPTVTFGGNKVSLALPVRVVSGTGRATINFTWDGKNISGAVCGDQNITQVVSGGVKQASYPVAGGLHLTASAERILAEPLFPTIRMKVNIVPSADSWAAAQKILDDKKGVCGFVLDKVKVLDLVGRLIDRGFNVRLPTEKIKPLAIPVGVNPTMQVRGQPVALGITVSGLAITKHAIWLGSDVQVAVGEAAVQAAAAAVPPQQPKAPARARRPARSAAKP